MSLVITSVLDIPKYFGVQYYPYYEGMFYPQGEYFKDMVVLLFSTFLSSIWLWMFAVLSSLIHVGFRVDMLKRIIAEHFDTENKPLSVLGWVAIAATTMVFCGAMIACVA